MRHNSYKWKLVALFNCHYQNYHFCNSLPITIMLSRYHVKNVYSPVLTLLIPRCLQTTLNTKEGSVRTGPATVSSTIRFRNMKFCRILRISLKVSKNLNWVKILVWLLWQLFNGQLPCLDNCHYINWKKTTNFQIFWGYNVYYVYRVSQKSTQVWNTESLLWERINQWSWCLLLDKSST